MFWSLSFGIQKCKNVVRKTNFHGLIFNISNATEFKIIPYIYTLEAIPPTSTHFKQRFSMQRGQSIA